VINFAAESHVDRSIHGPEDFIQTNVRAPSGFWRPYGTTGKRYQLSIKKHSVPACEHRRGLRHPGQCDPAFTEDHTYEPNSPYSASKAASDHLVRAWHHTYGLPVLTTNCSNNYGPCTFPKNSSP
jgi:dTDP-glucose 4,6-dehydratase